MARSIKSRMALLESRLPSVDAMEDAIMRKHLALLTDAQLHEMGAHVKALNEGREATPLSFAWPPEGCADA